ncbi:MAG: hypothetical protein C0403_01450, partial [Desulfobacterium sp.]|nr:hypothetical protein [Desulfobacterium sp.]
RKELKILDSATLHFVSSFRRNYNNRLLKLAQIFNNNQIKKYVTARPFYYLEKNRRKLDSAN